LTFDWSNIDFLSRLENSFVFNHINKHHILLRKFSHTHAKHELSILFKISICRKIYASWLLDSQLYVVKFLICYLTMLSVLHTCVLWSQHWKKKKFLCYFFIKKFFFFFFLELLCCSFCLNCLFFFLAFIW